jgi:hypothetical protein
LIYIPKLKNTKELYFFIEVFYDKKWKKDQGIVINRSGRKKYSGGIKKTIIRI